ncbi:MAG: hypothetical protein R3310_15420 [Candidatus Competibacteraceae bacterium]|nr:hypothetical protein [Candidatus Competibacteraceae bacterium]
MDQLLSLREIDLRHRVPKGTAFKAFKSLAPDLEEGQDYLYLTADDKAIQSLKAAGRLYPTTINAVLLTPRGYARLKGRLPPERVS